MSVFTRNKAVVALQGLVTAALLSTTLFAGTAHAAPATNGVDVSSYDSKIKNDGTNVYYPTSITAETPVALLLQGGKVHRQHYTEYAKEVASQGFIVVTPNHKRLNFFDRDYYTSTAQIGETLAWMKSEDTNNASPIKGKIDEDALVLLGHSFGGATGLSISESKCSIPFCTGFTFKLPSEVKAGSFYGANNQILGITLGVKNKIPVQLVQGSQDGVAAVSAGQATYNKMTGKKQFVEVAGANHYGITNTQDPSGANAEANGQSLTQSESISTTALWAGQFLKAQLGDPDALAFISGMGNGGVTVQSAL